MLAPGRTRPHPAAWALAMEVAAPLRDEPNRAARALTGGAGRAACTAQRLAQLQAAGAEPAKDRQQTDATPCNDMRSSSVSARCQCVCSRITRGEGGIPGRRGVRPGGGAGGGGVRAGLRKQHRPRRCAAAQEQMQSTKTRETPTRAERNDTLGQGWGLNS